MRVLSAAAGPCLCIAALRDLDQQIRQLTS
jgi:hypothetical protein